MDYPQLSVRVPETTLERLQAICEVVGEAQWRVLSDAVDRYIAQLASDERDLLEALLQRATGVFSQPAKRRAASSGAPPVTVLNVDDFEPMLYARSAILKKEGWHVLEARTGRAALEVVKRHRPDVVLLDVHLPDIDGLEVCRRIKSDPKTRAIKVVQVSATVKTPLDQLHSLAEGGADIYLTEPLSRGTLLSVIERLLNRGVAASAATPRMANG